MLQRFLRFLADWIYHPSAAEIDLRRQTLIDERASARGLREDIELENRKLDIERERLAARKAEAEEFGKNLLVREADVRLQGEKMQEAETLAKAWRPFVKEHKPTLAHQKALADGASTILLECIEILAKERIRQFSNRALVAMDGGVAQAKPLWMAAGVNALLQDILDTARYAERRQEREEAHVKEEARKLPPDETLSPRDMNYLYNHSRPLETVLPPAPDVPVAA